MTNKQSFKNDISPDRPLIAKWARGSKLCDTDGNEYVDFCLNHGALIVGHAHRNVVLSAKKHAERGISFGVSTRAEMDLAGYIVNAVPSLDKVCFLNSSTEAVMSAVALARKFTGRRMAAMAAVMEEQDAGEESDEAVMRIPFNDTQAWEEAIERHHDQIACVLIEPVVSVMGPVAAKLEFLQSLRRLTRQYGIVLIFDEVVSGFRAQIGCAQSEFGIIPDMTCLGNIIGGGFPVGAYGGRQDIMSSVAPEGGSWQAGIFAGSPVILRAGLMTLRLLNDGFYAALNQKAENLRGRLNAFFMKHNFAVHVAAFHSMMGFRFCRDSVENGDDARSALDADRYSRMFHYLLARGVYIPPNQREPFFICGAHTKKDLTRLREEIEKFFLDETGTRG